MDGSRNEARENCNPHLVVGSPVHLDKEVSHEIDTRLFKRRHLLHSTFRKRCHSLVLRTFEVSLTFHASCDDALCRLKTSVDPIALSNRVEGMFGSCVHLVRVHAEDERPYIFVLGRENRRKLSLVADVGIYESTADSHHSLIIDERIVMPQRLVL